MVFSANDEEKKRLFNELGGVISLSKSSVQIRSNSEQKESGGVLIVAFHGR